MNIVHFSPFNLGMKIPIGRGGLYKTFNGINNHVIPQGIGPMNTPFDLILLLFPYLLRCYYYPLFPLRFGCEKSRLVVVDYVRPP